MKYIFTLFLLKIKFVMELQLSLSKRIAKGLKGTAESISKGDFEKKIQIKSKDFLNCGRSYRRNFQEISKRVAESIFKGSTKSISGVAAEIS